MKSSRCQGVVVATGMETRIGDIAKMMASEDKGDSGRCNCLPKSVENKTPLQEKACIEIRCVDMYDCIYRFEYAYMCTYTYIYIGSNMYCTYMYIYICIYVLVLRPAGAPPPAPIIWSRLSHACPQTHVYCPHSCVVYTTVCLCSRN